MANKSKSRLSRAHYDTARELRWIYESPGDWPQPPRSVKQQTSLYLNRLAKDAGVDRAGLNAEEIYIKAVRAIMEATGSDANPSVRQLQNLAAEWDKSRQKIRDAVRASKGVTSSDVKTLCVAEGWGRELAEFGILGGDEVEAQTVDTPRPGEVVVLTDEKGTAVGRFVRFDDEPDGRWIVIEDADYEHSYRAGDLRIFRPLRIIRRFDFEAPEAPATGDALSPETRSQIEALRRKLDRLYEPENEAARFLIEREIYVLEHAAECAEDEWPELVAA